MKHYKWLRYSLGCALALQSPFACIAGTIVVGDETGNLVPNADVFVNCAPIGATNGSGFIDTPLKAGDHVMVRKIRGVSPICTTADCKRNHDANWSYRIWHTNVVQNDDGSWSDTVVGDPAQGVPIRVRADNAVIGFNLVGSVEYNATRANLEEIGRGFSHASEFLYDVSDGQMVFENVTLYEDGRNFADADAQFYEDHWPQSESLYDDPKQILLGPWSHMYFPGAGFEGKWHQPKAFRVLTHEFLHYSVGAADEYSLAGRLTMCTLDRATQQESVRASIMDNERNATEICNDSNHNPNTQQGTESVWSRLARNWGDEPLRLKTPMTRGAARQPPLAAVTNPGPSSVPCMFETRTRIEESPVKECPPIEVTATHLGDRVGGATAVWLHQTFLRQVGLTSRARRFPYPGGGTVMVHGAIPGDRISLRKPLPDTTYRTSHLAGGATVQSCDPITIEMKEYVRFNYAFAPKFRLPVREFELTLPYTGSTPQLKVSVRAPGDAARELPLALNAETQRYAGALRMDLRKGATLEVSVEGTTDEGEEVHSFGRFRGTLFHREGRGTGPGEVKAPLRAEPEGFWQLFGGDAPIDLTVLRESLDDGTSITVGQTDAPAPLPEGWELAAQPAFVGGDRSLHGTATLSLRYDLQRTCAAQTDCKVDPEQLVVMHYNGQNWDKLPISLNAEHDLLAADITEWGYYAIGMPAQP